MRNGKVWMKSGVAAVCLLLCGCQAVNIGYAARKSKSTQRSAGIIVPGNALTIGYQVTGKNLAVNDYVAGLRVNVPLNLSWDLDRAGKLEVDGVEIGVVNRTTDGSGVQIGLVNLSKEWCGLQLGLVNYCPNAWIPFLPIVNWAQGAEKSAPEVEKPAPEAESSAECS